MATFTALNIEPDEHPDDEVDNTKELQIEDALKLYQAALKLHSQGPTLYPNAAAAYMNLFKSEIFSYPESETEFGRFESHPELDHAEAAFALELAAAGAGETPSTLPQILYLSYKNHGQFILDCVKALQPNEPLPRLSLEYQAKAAIDNFALALASDESDTDLWRRAARIGAMLGSKRISRYCLEAAVEVDDDPTVAEVEPASLEEGFAGEQLKEQLEVLADETALSHPIMAPFQKKPMSAFLAKHMDPYPFLPDPSKSLESEDRHDVQIIQSRLMIPAATRTWTEVGDKLFNAWMLPTGPSGTAVGISLPLFLSSEQQQTAREDSLLQDQIMKDVATTESPTVETSECGPNPSTPLEESPVLVTTTTTTVPLAEEKRASMSLPTRKRSQSAAGLRDTPDDDSGAQKRSKRIRNRDNTVEEVDLDAQYAEQLKSFERGDNDVFKFVGDLLSKLGINDLGTFSELQTALALRIPTDRAEIVANTAVRDLRDILRSWDECKASAFANSNAADILGSASGGSNAGLVAFLEHSNSGPMKTSSIPAFDESSGLEDFAQKLSSNWVPVQDAIFEWMCHVLPAYRTHLWSTFLKLDVVHIITFMDAELFARMKLEIESSPHDSAKRSRLVEMVEALFELHIDIYSRITNPNSTVDYSTRITARDRLDRWAIFAADVVGATNRDSTGELAHRYLWASVFYATMADDTTREHKVSCWSDLQSILRESGQAAIELQNNAVMPEISVEAADREVSRLTTMDFFFNLFQADRSDPLAIIETLEPVLDPESACQPILADGEEPNGDSDATGTPSVLRDMWKFLRSGSTSLRLFLWQRLREAYFSIGYNTKVFSCHLKSIEIIVGDLRSDDFVDSANEGRQLKLLTWLKALDDLLVKALTIALNDAATCFEIIDERHIHSTCAAIAQLNRVLHSAAIFDDEVRVGMTVISQGDNTNQGSFASFTNKLREMQVRTWALQYTMIKEAISQNREIFPTPDNDLADYLALVHYSLGVRKSCRASNKIFLKMMKVEMIRLKNVERWEDYLGQVLFDLYGISLGVGTFLLEDHGCPTEQLDRRTVLNIADQVILLANRIPIKDLLKHDLRQTIEKMQTAVGQAKPSIHMAHNLKNLTGYLKLSIRPLDLYKAWKGQTMVDSVPVNTQETPLADKGWYFLLGMIALAKFRSQKRLGPGAQTDDLNIAATFFRLQLQFSADHWETWFRLAQCFDYELEEEVMWSADKINNQKPTLVKLQRNAIHCYVMALSTAVRTADDSFETSEKLSEMYHEFGMRLYASSREPFSMEAFWVDEFAKHMSGSTGMYKRPLHDEMSRYRAWKYTAKLFKEALREKPNDWMNHYMLGKCLWKMFQRSDEEWDAKLKADKPTVEDVLKPFINAIKTVPKPTRANQEPILEPHYKLIAIVHKLVRIEELDAQVGADLLQQQPYAYAKGESQEISSRAHWEAFILNSIRHLKKEDKQHWQHRMIARMATILYDENDPAAAEDQVRATAAKAELQNSIFTKTMVIQVWKPDAERAGRHCVYMNRYVRLMTKLLTLTSDKTNMEALAKRVRKKANDFYRFVGGVWTVVCTAYLRLIRSTAKIETSMDDVFKHISSEEFEIIAERIAIWVTDPRMTHPALDAVRETAELKRLNGKLMKDAALDDLLNDAYAVLYTEIGKHLPGSDPSLARAQVDGASDASGLSTRPLGAMSLSNLVMDMNGTQIPVPVTIAGSEATRQRKVGIARREVLRRAEAIVNRAPDPPRAIAPSTSRPQPAPPMILGSNAGPEQPRGKEEESERGSVHDSADDESDLSDVPGMDDEDPALIFPNLLNEGGS